MKPMNVMNFHKNNIKNELILYAAYATLASLILYSLEVFLTVFRPDFRLISFYALDVLFSVVVYVGWYVAGRKTKNRLLENISLVAVILVPLAGTINVIFDAMGILNILFTLTYGIMLGIILTVFGTALMRLEKKYGKLAKYTGILEIIGGISLVTLILSPLLIILLPVVLILEALLLFKIY